MEASETRAGVATGLLALKEVWHGADVCLAFWDSKPRCRICLVRMAGLTLASSAGLLSRFGGRGGKQAIGHSPLGAEWNLERGVASGAGTTDVASMLGAGAVFGVGTTEPGAGPV